MSPTTVKPSSLYSESRMVDNTRVKFDVPIGTWGHTEVEVEYPWHRGLDSIILPLLESAHEAQAERQRKHRSENTLHPHKSLSKSKRISKGERQEPAIPAKPEDNVKIVLKGHESAKEVDLKRSDTLQKVLEQYAQQAEKDVERLQLFYKGRHAGSDMTPDSGSRTVRNCKSLSSFSSADEESRKHQSQIAQGKPRANTGTIYVANGIDEICASMAPPESRLEPLHSDSGSESGSARQILDVESAFEDVPPPMEAVWTQPGPSRRISRYRTRSIISDKALTILGLEDFPPSAVSLHTRQFPAQRSGSDATAALPPFLADRRSLNVPYLSPLGSNPLADPPMTSSSESSSPCRPRDVLEHTQSFGKARKMLGLNQPDRRADTQAGSITGGTPHISRKHFSYPEADIESRHGRSRSFGSDSSGRHPKLTTIITGPATYRPQVTELRPTRENWTPPCIIANQETIERATAADKRASKITGGIRPPVDNIQYEVERKRTNLGRRCPKMSGFWHSAAEAVC